MQKDKKIKADVEEMTKEEQEKWEESFSKGILITDPLPDKQPRAKTQKTKPN